MRRNIPEQEGDALMVFLITIILIVFLYDFTKLRQQNKEMIEQNKKIISVLEDIKRNEKM